MKIVLGTQNPGKLREFKQLAGDVPWLELILPPGEFDPEETGCTFLENAIIKAQAAAYLTGMTSVADDSGLTVDALSGRPGVQSSRYSGGDEALGRNLLMSELDAVPEGRRDAAYICNMVVCGSTGEILFTAEGRWCGKIGYEERGNNGFGFDPIFYLPDRNVTVAELPADEKNILSHRGQAWRKVLQFLSSLEMG